MSLGLAFWICMLVWLIIGVYRTWPNPLAGGENLILFLVLCILGWHAFGPPIRG